MSKTKEEIIEEYIPCTCGEIYTSRKMVAPDCPQHAFAVEEAMDEHAKNQAIDFAEWISRLGLFQGIILEWYDRYDKKIAETTIELYALFLQSQSE